MSSPSKRSSPAEAVVWPARRLLDPRFADVNRRLTDAHRAVNDEAEATRAAIDGYAETNVESLTHLGIELRRFQEALDAQAQALEAQADALAGHLYVQRVDAMARGSVDGLDAPAAALIDHALSHTGFAAEADLWLNPPIVLQHGEGSVAWSATNERIVEVPFTFAALADLEPGSRILDVGGAESTISFSLASLGHEVTVLEPRGYPFHHPGLHVAATTIERFDAPPGSFDAILLVSTIEHVGLGFYDAADDDVGDRGALERLGRLLAPGGLLVVTVPYGTRSVTEKERTYDAPSLDALLDGWSVERRQIAERGDDGRTWTTVEASTGPAVAMIVARRA